MVRLMRPSMHQMLNVFIMCAVGAVLSVVTESQCA